MLHLWGQVLFSSDTDKLWNQMFMNLLNYEFAKTPSKYLHRVPVVTGIFFSKYHDCTILNAFVPFSFVLLLPFGFCCGCCCFVSFSFWNKVCTPCWPRTHYVAQVGFNQTWNSPRISASGGVRLCAQHECYCDRRGLSLSLTYLPWQPSPNINMSYSVLTWSDTWIGHTFKMLWPLHSTQEYFASQPLSFKFQASKRYQGQCWKKLTCLLQDTFPTSASLPSAETPAKLQGLHGAELGIRRWPLDLPCF